MSATSEHLTELELRSLLNGTASDVDTERFTEHLESCPLCQSRLQALASGEIPIEKLVKGLMESVPPEQSAYWPAVAAIQQEVALQIHQGHSAARDVPVVTGGNTPADAVETMDGSALDPTVNNRPVPSYSQQTGLEFLEPSDDPAYIGKLNHFQIARVIGRGGMGIVLEAFDTHLQRSVAIKVLNPHFQENDVARQRFCREGRAAAAITHEHVVAMHQVAKADGGSVAYLVMQLIDGDTLDTRIKDGSPLPPADVARIGMQIASGLSAAHKQGMVHRDIKPANILIEADTERVKLTDFGLARAADDVRLTKTGMVTGTPLYMSPEQTLGETSDERSDLFSLGAVLYEVATGVAPFQAPSALGVMKRIVDETPKAPHLVNDQIPKPLSDLIMTLLEKKSEDRPESAAVVASALATTAQTLGSVSPMDVPSISAKDVGNLSGNYSRLARRYAVAAWTAGVIAVASLAFALWTTRERWSGPDFPSVVLPDNPGTVWSIDFSDDGSHLLAAIEDGTVRMWSVDQQDLEKSFNAHRGIVWMVCYSPDESMIATSGDDGLVRFWDAETFQPLGEFDADSAVRGIAFSSDGERLMAGNRDGRIDVIDVATATSIRSVTQPGSILGIDISADGKWIATGGSDKMVRIFDAESLEVRQTLTGHAGPIYNVRFADSGPNLATVGWNKNVLVWNVDTGQVIHDLKGSEGDVWGVSFCTDGSHLVTGEQTGVARVWDLSNGEPVATLRKHTSAVHNVSLDPSAMRIATSSRDGTIRIWDMSAYAESP
ncbi:MAG: serine/threonine-protein kinase [Planctomycetota bacterium]